MPDVPNDIQFDSYDFQDDTIITSDVVGDDSAPKKSVGIYELPVLHGAKKTFEKYQARRITLQGIIKSPTASGLIGKMEQMKEVVSRQDKQLTLTYPSYTRIYTGVSSEAGVEFTRPSYAINIADYSVTFICPEPWSVQTTTSVSGVYSVTSAITNLSVGISGMLDPQPYIYFNTLASGSRFVFMNTTTGDTIDVPTTFSGFGRSLLIDPYNYQVTLDGAPVTFRGTFPRFKPGVNSLAINTYGTAGSAVDQSYENTATANDTRYFGNNNKVAQTFVPGRTSINTIELYLALSNPTGASDITVAIHSTSGGAPTSSVVASTTLAALNSSTPAWRKAIFASPVSVTPGTTYAIVVTSSASPSISTYKAMASSANPYASGTAYVTNQFGTWTAYSTYDLLFRVLSDQGTALSGTLVIQYNPRRL